MAALNATNAISYSTRPRAPKGPFYISVLGTRAKGSKEPETIRELFQRVNHAKIDWECHANDTADRNCKPIIPLPWQKTPSMVLDEVLQDPLPGNIAIDPDGIYIPPTKWINAQKQEVRSAYKAVKGRNKIGRHETTNEPTLNAALQEANYPSSPGQEVYQANYEVGTAPPNGPITRLATPILMSARKSKSKVTKDTKSAKGTKSTTSARATKVTKSTARKRN